MVRKITQNIVSGCKIVVWEVLIFSAIIETKHSIFGVYNLTSLQA